MRVGICAFWFNRGQGVVARQLRSALDELGHETFVLGRPTKESFPMPQEARGDDVWAQSGVTPASDFFIPAAELVDWAREAGIEACFFDQNYEFEAIAALRAAGVRTIGRFVWERFSDEHVEPAKRSYDLVYSLTRAEQERYAGMGIEAPYVRYGIHPEYFEVTPHRGSDPESSYRQRAAGTGREAEDSGGVIPAGRVAEDSGGGVYFHYHAGLLGKRKPFKEVIRAFSATREPESRLIVKAQIERRMNFLERAVKDDPRIELVLEDLPTDVHLQMFADADVCMAPARWEGLGLHLYEAIAFGQPIVCNDDPPMNELVSDGVNGLLVPSHADGLANSGIPARTVDVDALAAAISRLADPDLRAELSAGALKAREERTWARTIEDFASLLKS
ncbi:MAG TPA: glycosyltransferase family 4 protein [Solirubrobacterales bacterium]|nr:glycosyltransferase family 4 protein [Solirubrobacterales bacterium]